MVRTLQRMLESIRELQEFVCGISTRVRIRAGSIREQTTPRYVRHASVPQRVIMSQCGGGGLENYSCDTKQYGVYGPFYAGDDRVMRGGTCRPVPSSKKGSDVGRSMRRAV